MICLTETLRIPKTLGTVFSVSLFAPPQQRKPERDRDQDHCVSKRTPRQAPVYLPIPYTGS
jgi:hypothetical protein